ncbi:pyridoxal phosphate-dependent aminotransferase [Gilvimarinus agarilyticus]|uniref:alanine transaminase n=1 Tax=Reichenbachiella agariperforans TaxID=156994 RepID=A0A1M6R457_REIAG|nr:MULTISPECIES: pyridoxal phosphate-dependent aminotransferase [Reichenbachiella]MBU2884168.1 pyridoxal phosphate-dependent aminotransferase [Gilvimarinus agarilyticus]MBU2912808.1 pyridoxal phosphate-dependent aminotransferase [Reichenbachiella agariperforans]PIB34135.1 aminotransferase [Reichenbachiella sp. 5M10]RJE70677.1 aminotransferase [Reichenbachiella sp. MSK19-1]SHK27190.1 Aspartate/methionine/tyrosine aminotransferase [Reichenbachiella agariperforans]
MRQVLLHEGSRQLDYEIRDIVKKAEALQALGQKIYWENIGDPILKHAVVPAWIKEILTTLVNENSTYGYCHSKGELETRKYVAGKNNEKGGAQITADDVLFFNGLGDAIGKLYQFLNPYSRVIGPSPAYSTHSALEAAHSNKEPLTYNLDPENNWYPDLADLRLKVKYNPNIVGILIINPDNPTGMVYPVEILEEIVEIAREFNLFLVSDEIYTNIIYNGVETKSLAEVLGDVPGIAMKGISKDTPWPGSRCGWMEFYNRKVDEQFDQYCSTLENAKMVEVCSTTLPQKALPIIQEHPKFKEYLRERRKEIEERSEIISQYLHEIPYITFNKTNGAFYNTIVFKDGSINDKQFLKIEDEQIQALAEDWVEKIGEPDKRFVYYLLAAKGVCVVPLSSFQSELRGFRITLLEENQEVLKQTFSKIAEAIYEFCTSDVDESVEATLS